MNHYKYGDEVWVQIASERYRGVVVNPERWVWKHPDDFRKYQPVFREEGGSDFRKIRDDIVVSLSDPPWGHSREACRRIPYQ